MSATALTYLDAARMMRELEAMRDDSYQRETLLGPVIVDYLAYKRVEEGLAGRSLDDREYVLRYLAIDHADLDVQAFGTREGTRLLRRFIMARWGDAAPSTRGTRTSFLRDFFGWAFMDERIDFDPARAIRSPKAKGKRRQAHDREIVVRLVQAQPTRNERLAVRMMAQQGFRKNELRTCQLGHFDFVNGVVHVFGKGSKPAVVPLAPDLGRELEAYVLERSLVSPRDYRQEHLLFWQKVARFGSYPNYRVDLVREDRLRPLGGTAMHDWWRRCLDRAGLAPFPMHELRHTAGTAFHIEHGDYELTRQFMRHENVQTTAGYIHVPSSHLTAAVRAMPDLMGKV